MIGGLIFLGFALQDLLPWIATAFAWAIYVFGAVHILCSTYLHFPSLLPRTQYFWLSLYLPSESVVTLVWALEFFGGFEG
jgi:hypothetical protein